MNTTVLATAVTAKLTALGDTEPDVADTLRRAGARGFRSSLSGCPIANYLTAQDDLGLIGAYTSAVDVYVVAVDGTVVEFLVPPPAVAGFITEFDLGEFADLSYGVSLTWQNRTEGTVGGGR